MTRAQFQASLTEAHGYLKAIVGWLRKVGLEEEALKEFEEHINKVMAAASKKAPQPAKVIDIKDYLPKR